MALMFLAFSIGCLAYTYLGYPLALVAMAWVRRRHAGDPPEAAESAAGDGRAPIVSVIIAAYNEADVIAARVRNVLAQGYPADRMEVIVGSDGSTDATVRLAAEIDDPRVRVLDLPREGKAMAHNACAGVARGEILMFTDARTVFEAGCIAALVAPFSDPTVGCTTGHLRFTNTDRPGIPQGAGWYWNYELLLRRLETNAGSCAAVTGACMAMRARLFRKLAATDDIDDAAPVDMVLAGSRVVFAPKAEAYDRAPASSADEIAARRRIVTKNLQAIVNRPGVLSPVRHPQAAWQLVSHRVMRYLTPLFLVLLFGSNALMHEGAALRALWTAQVLFYGGAAIGLIADRLRINVPVISTMFAFCLANLGFLLGLWNIVRGRGVTVFEPIR